MVLASQKLSRSAKYCFLISFRVASTTCRKTACSTSKDLLVNHDHSSTRPLCGKSTVTLHTSNQSYFIDLQVGPRKARSDWLEHVLPQTQLPLRNWSQCAHSAWQHVNAATPPSKRSLQQPTCHQQAPSATYKP